MTLVLLAEDDESLYPGYISQLEASNFTVLHAKSGIDLVDMAVWHRPKIVISDTHLDDRTYGDEACRFLLKHEIIDDTLLIAMSSMRNNDEKWIGLAHDFFWKDGIDNLGAKVELLYEEFQKNPGMPRYKVFPKH